MCDIPNIFKSCKSFIQVFTFIYCINRRVCILKKQRRKNDKGTSFIKFWLETKMKREPRKKKEAVKRELFVVFGGNH